MVCVKCEGVVGEHKLSDKQRGLKLCCTSLYPTSYYSLQRPGSISHSKDAETGPQFLTQKLTILPACKSYTHFLLHERKEQTHIISEFLHIKKKKKNNQQPKILTGFSLT